MFLKIFKTIYTHKDVYIKIQFQNLLKTNLINNLATINKEFRKTIAPKFSKKVNKKLRKRMCETFPPSKIFNLTPYIEN